MLTTFPKIFVQSARCRLKDVEEKKRRYQGMWNINRIADCCLVLKRDDLSQEETRKVLKGKSVIIRTCNVCVLATLLMDQAVISFLSSKIII